ncbi:hypothetical protein [Embleya sp. NPDC059237]|uniref:hypothetical protein n=1 Tax=Embleya sp. NPDC059237 TaxID=3346784 RepID=UPI0036907F3E
MSDRSRRYLRDVGERVVATFVVTFAAVGGAPLVAGSDPETAWGAVADLGLVQRATIAGVVAVLTLLKGVVGTLAGDRLTAAWVASKGPWRYAVDLAERAAATFVAVFLSVWGTPLVAGADPGTAWGAVADLSLVQKGVIAGAVAVLTLLKGVIATWVGDRASAALLPGRAIATSGPDTGPSLRE